MLSLVVAVAGLVAVVAFVAAPLVRSRSHETSESVAAREAFERRDRALAALRELEFDHRTGKLTDADYAALLGPLRRDAAEALQAVAGST
jgi:hypothetical protein